MEAIPFSGSHFFSASHPFEWNPSHLREAVSFSGKYSFKSKLILLVEAIPFDESISVVETLPVMEAISLSGKSLLLVKTVPFSGTGSF